MWIKVSLHWRRSCEIRTGADQHAAEGLAEKMTFVFVDAGLLRGGRAEALGTISSGSLSLHNHFTIISQSFL